MLKTRTWNKFGDISRLLPKFEGLLIVLKIGPKMTFKVRRKM